MRYGGKYNLTRRLIVEGKQKDNDEAFVAAQFTKIGAAIKSGSLANMVAVDGGTTGADVTITLSDETMIPVECKLSYDSTYGNPSLRGGSGIVTDPNGTEKFVYGMSTTALSGQQKAIETELLKAIAGIVTDPNGTEKFVYGMSKVLSPQQKAIETELLKAIAAANANPEAVAGALAAEKRNISGNHAGCKGTGHRTEFPNGGLAAKWYRGKGTKGADYIHVKDYGLYLLIEGNDPLGLNALLPKNKQIPLYKPSAGEAILVRMKMMPKKSSKWNGIGTEPTKNCSPMAQIEARGSLTASPWDLYNTAPFIAAINQGVERMRLENEAKMQDIALQKDDGSVWQQGRELGSTERSPLSLANSLEQIRYK